MGVCELGILSDADADVSSPWLRPPGCADQCEPIGIGVTATPHDQPTPNGNVVRERDGLPVLRGSRCLGNTRPESISTCQLPV